MGVRDRIKNKIKQKLLKERKSTSADTSSVRSPARPNVSAEPTTQLPPKTKPSKEPESSTAVYAGPNVQPPPKTKPSNKPVPTRDETNNQAPESPSTFTAAPAQKKLKSKPHNDAPSRNAHLRPTFNTSTAAFNIQIEHGDTGLKESFPCEPDEFVLEAAERAGIELPFSCRSGGCLSCAGQLINGETEMTEQFVLEESHIAEGFRLLCCTTVQSNASFVTNQEEAID